MIINNLNIVCILVLPFETDSPLIVNANAVLSFSIPGQSFKLVSRRDSKVLDCRTPIQHPELSKCDLLNIVRQLFGKLAMKYLFSFTTLEAFYHNDKQYNA
jgi:hypothetical protein